MSATDSKQPTVVEAIAKVMEEVQAIGKGDRNDDQGYAFRGVDATINAVGPILRRHGVIVMPVGVDSHYRDVQTSRGKPSRECTIVARYRWFGPGGDFIDAEVPGEAMDFGDKGTPKAMSVAYRTLLLQGLCIPTGEREPDAQSYERDHAPEPERTTDFMWLEDIRTRVTACTTVAEVRGLWSEAVQVYADGRLSTEDSAALKAEMDGRAKELKGESVMA